MKPAPKSTPRDPTREAVLEILRELNVLPQPAAKPGRPGSRRRGPTKQPVTHDDVLSFRIPAAWKANIVAELEGMGLPKRRHAEFFRGAIVAELGAAKRAQSPAWAAFVKAAQPLAKAKLGMELKDEGLEAILRLGTILD